MSSKAEQQSKHRLGFQGAIVNHANSDTTANEMVLQTKTDTFKFFGQQPPLAGADGREHRRFVGDHFSRNVDLIDNTDLFLIAQQMPKGAHLHIHFNSTLLPKFLLDHAKEMENMYIWSDRQLVSRDNLANCKIEFSLRHFDTLWGGTEKADGLKLKKSKHGRITAHDEHGPNLFSNDYKSGTEMRYQYFRQQWESHRPLEHVDCDDWLTSKLVFSKEEVDAIYQPLNYARAEESKEKVEAAESGWPEDIQKRYQESEFYDIRKRAANAWDKFNGRTKMMKGLFNYETAFRAYTRKCLEEFVRDNVQYAEIRPNFMPSNQILQDNGQKSNIDNRRTMEIIIEEYERFMVDIGDMTEDRRIKENRKLHQDGSAILDEITGLPLGNGHRPSFGGLKVIYCTPRSFSKAQVQEALEQCIEFKKEWPQYIAGFDLVGEEAYDKKYPLKYFEEEFNSFKARCEEENVDIPFLFHCGETPDDIEDNLDWALEYGSRRIGHGYALPHKKDIMEKMKINNVCVETCPISNMILGLAETMTEHNIYELLDNDVHCAVSSDNGTLFRSTLSHDFFEVMVGHNKINLYGWEQLARWSIDHACLDQAERERVLAEWQTRWREFVAAIKNSDTGRDSSVKEIPAKALRMVQLEKARQKAEERQRQEKTPA
ncbi:hypothetical protein F5X99DRAFT_405764 [Biscogniauxia marginata]|nr:hypothetical protein F5X99DRAFT_405764 [Biscogniauxia marginata]